MAACVTGPEPLVAGMGVIVTSDADFTPSSFKRSSTERMPTVLRPERARPPVSALMGNHARSYAAGVFYQ